MQWTSISTEEIKQLSDLSHRETESVSVWTVTESFVTLILGWWSEAVSHCVSLCSFSSKNSKESVEQMLKDGMKTLLPSAFGNRKQFVFVHKDYIQLNNIDFH